MLFYVVFYYYKNTSVENAQNYFEGHREISYLLLSILCEESDP